MRDSRFRAPDPLRRLAEFGATGFGIISLEEARSLGISAKQMHRWAARGVVTRVYPQVYAIGHTALSIQGRIRAATLAVPGAQVTGTTALALWRILPMPVLEPVHLLATRRHRPLSGVKLHHTARWLPVDRRLRDGIPVSSPSRSLFDAGADLSEYQLTRHIHEAAYHQRLDVDSCLELCERLPTLRSARVMRGALELYLAGSAGVRSSLEMRMLTRLRELGVPTPDLNKRIQVGTRSFELDFYWDTIQLNVEVDGPGHARPPAQRADAARDAHLAAHGIWVIRSTSSNLERTAQRVQRIFARHSAGCLAVPQSEAL